MKQKSRHGVIVNHPVPATEPIGEFMHRILLTAISLAIFLSASIDQGHTEQRIAQTQDRATTGQGAAGTQSGLSATERSRIMDILRKQGFREATEVKFPLSVGADVPISENLFPLPVSIAEIRSEWRDYHYIVVYGKAVIVDPRELKVKAVIEP